MNTCKGDWQPYSEGVVNTGELYAFDIADIEVLKEFMAAVEFIVMDPGDEIVGDGLHFRDHTTDCIEVVCIPDVVDENNGNRTILEEVVTVIICKGKIIVCKKDGRKINRRPESGEDLFQA
jgi:hypothetical protein